MSILMAMIAQIMFCTKITTFMDRFFECQDDAKTKPGLFLDMHKYEFELWGETCPACF